MNDIERIKLNRAIDEMLRNSIAESPRQAATLRELVLDAIEEAGFEIVGKNMAAPSSTADQLKLASARNGRENTSRTAQAPDRLSQDRSFRLG